MKAVAFESLPEINGFVEKAANHGIHDYDFRK